MSSKSEVRRKIKSIKSRGARLDKDIHECAVQTLVHMQSSRDVTLASELVAAMPRSGRRKSLIFWYRKHAPVRFGTKTEAFTVDKKRESKIDGYEDARKQGTLPGVDIESANAVPFYDDPEGREKEPGPFDLDRTISSFAKRLKKAKAEGKLDASPATVADRVRQTLNTALADAS